MSPVSVCGPGGPYKFPTGYSQRRLRYRRVDWQNYPTVSHFLRSRIRRYSPKPSSEFAESTILTIAHRLRTVIDYNRVMLLEDGKIVEFDTPGSLLANRDSKFYALCKATGKEEFSTLKRLAGVTSITGETVTTA